MIQITCTHCQAKMNVSDDKAGRSGKCPKCGGIIEVPSAAKGHASLIPPAGTREAVESGEIALAEQHSSRVAGESITRSANVREGIEGGEIPLVQGSGETRKETPQEPEAVSTAGGLVVTQAGDVTVVSFQNSQILDSLVIETIGQELYALVDKRACRKIALDFSNVEFLSSQMLGVLITLQKKVAGIKGRLMLCAVHSNLKKIFHIVNLERLLPMAPDRHTALGVLGLP